MNMSSVTVFKDSKKSREEKIKGTKSDLSALNELLFKSLERLDEMDLSGENFQNEIARAEAITKTAHTIIEQGQLALNYQKHLDDMGGMTTVQMPLIGVTDEKLIEENYNLRERVKKHESYR